MKTFASIAGRAIRTASGKADSRSKLIGAVRAACKRQRIDDDDRKAIQLEVTGKRSLGDMDLAEIGRVLDRLNKDYRGQPGHRAHVGKIRALWWTLYWLGAVDEPNDEALAAFVARQTGKERLPFLGPRDAYKVIEALKSWAGREGVQWPAEAALTARRATDPGVAISQLERHAVLDAIAAKLRRTGALKAGYEGYCEKALGLACNHWTWSDRELDQAIRLMGKMLRRQLDNRGGE